MTRDIRRRLEKLESQVPRQPTEQEKIVQLHQQFLRFAVAYYLGDLGPDQSVRAPMRGHWDIRGRLNFERPAKPTMQTLVRECAWPTADY